MRLTPEAIAAVLDEKSPPGPEIVEQVVRGLRIWMSAHGSLSLPRCIGLPSTTVQVRRALRDARLIEASSLFAGSAWQRAEQLCEAVRIFKARCWPCWFSMQAPPSHAQHVEAILWHAMSAAGGKLPTTPQAFARILSKQIEAKT